MKFIVWVMLTLFSAPELFAQETHFSGWGALFHTQRFSEKWGASFDMQFRSANKYAYLRNIILRPSLNYYIGKNKIAALGYAYIATYGRNAEDEHTFRPESRIWEQFIVNQKLDKAIVLQHRFRLEQRFVGNSMAADDHYFSQRLRYFARIVIPLKPDIPFTRGPFIGLQNEVFINVQNKNKVNGHIFDQNRALASIGFRLNKKIDAELGYLNQYMKHRDSYTINNVIQLACYTRF